MHQSILRFIALIGLGVIICLSTALILPSNFLGSISAIAQQPTKAVNISINLKKQIPQAVIVNSLSGKGIVTIGENKQLPAQVNVEIVRNRILGIPGSEKKSIGSNLGFLNEFKERIKGFIAAAGFSTVSSEYHYPCLTRGNFVIGWSSGLAPGGCPEVQYSPTGKPTKVGPKSLLAKELFEAPNPQQGVRQYWGQFCSVAAVSGNHWKIKLDNFDSNKEDICQQALVECQDKAKEKCFVTSRGDWRDFDTKLTNLNLLLRCEDNKQFYHQVIGARLEERNIYAFANQLEQQAISQEAKLCIFNIYSDQQVLISPSSNQRTLVHADSTEDGYVINDLVGTVTIRASENLEKEKPIELKPGESYRFRSSPKRGGKEPLTATECKSIVNLPIVKEFLDSNKWHEEIKPEIPQYQKALNEQFYQPLPTSASQLKGGEGWIATIDLSRPGTSLAVERNPGSSFDSYVNNRKSSVVMGGIYRIGKWNLKSGGKYISRGEQWGRRYTVLGLDKNNQLEIVTQTDPNAQPRWDQYQFAVQAGPRLVRGGTPTITSSSAMTEGHKLNITISTRRSGLGISKDGKKLYYVVASGASLRRLAEIMVSNGSYEAMALDGGNGPALGYNGSVKELPGETQPFFILANQTRVSGGAVARGCQEEK